MNDTSVFFSTRPALPWSVEPVGLPALAAVAILLVGLTVWTYLGHPQASRRRLFIVLTLRLLALVVALITALRPSVGFLEDPKHPSVLLIGIDLSESMTVKDEINGQSRIDAVRRTLDRCQATLDELASTQNVNVVMYKFSTPDFSPEVDRYDPKAPADGKKSDYGGYLNRTFDKWQGERYIRANLLIGDGANNGVAFSPETEAARWGRRNVPITTFTTGKDDTRSNARDLAVIGLAHDSAVPMKNDVTFTATVNAYGFAGARVKARLLFDDVEVAVEDIVLNKEIDNRIAITVKAPPTPGEVRVRFEIPVLPGEVSPLNNATDSYLTVTKEGLRVLVIDRLRWERVRILDALRPEKRIENGKEVERKRFDVYQVVRQSDQPATADERAYLDLDAQGYDAVVIGNIGVDQLRAVDPLFLDKLVERVTKKGMGLMMLGGEAAFTGMPAVPGGNPASRALSFSEILPVTKFGGLVDAKGKGYQTVPTPVGLDRFLMRVGKDVNESKLLWEELDFPSNNSRLTGYTPFTPKPTATVYAWATDASPAQAAAMPPPGSVPLLVGHQVGEGSRGRVLAFAGFDSYLWEKLGQPTNDKGIVIHNEFWRHCVLWLAHQEEEEGLVYARPTFRRIAVGGGQTIRVGLKTPAGVDNPTADLKVKILSPGEDEAKAPIRTVLRDSEGAKVLFQPPIPGEYTVVVTSPMLGPDGKPVVSPDGKPGEYRGTARFIAFPDVSDEMIKVSADHEFMTRIATASGGKALRLDDLPGFLKDLKAQPLETLKPKPRYVPDWRRQHSHGFLPGWLVLFVILLGFEWGLRRLWGMV